MAVEVQKGFLQNGKEYFHSRYFGTVEALEVLKRLVDNMVIGNKQNRTYVLSDWSDVEELKLDAEDTETIASTTSTVDFMDKKTFIAIFSLGNHEVHEHARDFIGLNGNEQIVIQLFEEKNKAIKWLEECV